MIILGLLLKEQRSFRIPLTKALQDVKIKNEIFYVK